MTSDLRKPLLSDVRLLKLDILKWQGIPNYSNSLLIMNHVLIKKPDQFPENSRQNNRGWIIGA